MSGHDTISIASGLDLDVSVVHIDLQDLNPDDINLNSVAPSLDADMSTLRSSLREWNRANGKSEATADTTDQTLRHFLWVLDHDSETVGDVSAQWTESYLKCMSNPSLADGDTTEVDGYADSTVRGRYNGIRRLYEFLDYSAEQSIENPTEDVSLGFLDNISEKKKSLGEQGFHALMPEQKEELADHAGSPATRNELVIRLTYQTGVRVSELVSLEVTDIDRGNNTVEIPAIKSRGRTVPFDQQLETLLEAYLSTRRLSLPGVSQSNPYMFPSREGDHNAISTSRANEIVVEAADRAGLRHEYGVDKMDRVKTVPTAHTLRHSFAVQCVRNGMALPDLKYAMGHSELENTLVYLRGLTKERTERLRNYSAGPTNDGADVARSSLPVRSERFIRE